MKKICISLFSLHLDIALFNFMLNNQFLINHTDQSHTDQSH